MTFSTLLLALLIALLCGALFHLLRGGSGWRLLSYFGLSVLGFALGQLISTWRGWNLWVFGSLDLGVGVIGSVLFLALGEWLGRIDAQNKSSV